MKLLIAALALAFASGCSTSGVIVDSSKIAGTQSTKAEVFGELGQPDVVEDIPAGTVWKYIQIKQRPSGYTYVPIVGMFAGGMTYDVDVTQVLFNPAGKMIHTYKTQDKESSNMWADYARLADTAIDGKDSALQQLQVRAEREMQSIGQEYVVDKDTNNTVVFYYMYQLAK